METTSSIRCSYKIHIFKKMTESHHHLCLQRVIRNHSNDYRLWIHRPPEKINTLWSKCDAPPPNKYFTVLCCNRPPLAGTSRHVQQAGLGLGLGLRVQGQGQAEMGLGGPGALGALPGHPSLALLKNFDFCHRPTTAPFRNDLILTTAPSPPPPKNND